MKRRFTTLLLALMGLTATAWADEHAYVDLGLPSGTLWATTNVGATEEYDSGDRYQWGETTPGTEYYHWSGWQYYVLCEGSQTTLTKYNNDADYGTVDNLTELLAAEDAASQQWGTQWCIPSKAQWQELIDPTYTTMTWTGLGENGYYKGFRITSRTNGNSIFIPAAGAQWSNSGAYYFNEWGYYWTRELNPGKPYQAYYLVLGENNQYPNSGDRYIGCTVRAVLNGMPIDEAHFPDANFRTFLLAQSYGTDGVLTTEEIAAIEELNVNGKHIADLTGIEYFTAMTELDAGNNDIASVDLSHNPGLTIVTLSENQLTSIDVSANTALEMLELSWNALTSIDLSANKKLVTLGLQQNQFTSIDFSANTALEYVLVAGNPLTDEGKALLISSIRDVSEATHAVEYMREFLLLVYTAENGLVSLTKKQAGQLKAKGWVLYAFDPTGGPIEYEGQGKDYSAYDVDGDGDFTLSDVTFLVNKLLEKQSEE